MDRDEVAKLTAVLEDDRLAIVEQTAQPDGGDAGVWIAQTLSRTVDVEEPRRDRRDAVRLPDQQHHLFLVQLGHRVDVVAVERLVLGRRN